MSVDTQNHLILGGTGFIGRHVAVALARAGHRVTITSRAPPAFQFPVDVAGRIACRVLDFAAPDWGGLLAGADTVHHYAWTTIPGSADASKAEDLRTNVGATIGLLEAMQRRGTGRIVFASSGGTIYGRLHTIPVSEEQPLAPITAYGVAKAAAELYIELHRATAGLDCRIARISNAYGAGQNPARGLGAVTIFVDHALRGERIEIWGDGEAVRDYIHVSDIASCLASLACASKTDTHVFNVGSGVGTSLNAIVAGLELRLGRRLDVIRTQPRAFDVPVSVLSIERVGHVLGWSPKLTLDAGITRMIADRQNGGGFSTLDHWSPAPAVLKAVALSSAAG